MYQSENINELASALAKAQGQINAASKDSSNPFYNSKYADLASVWNACREPLSKNGLAIIQTMNNLECGQLVLTTTLTHGSGQWIKSNLPIKFNENATEVNKFGKEIKVNALQKMGSCITYLRRYALAAIVGVCPDEDDDGNSGGEVYTKTNQEKKQKENNYVPNPEIEAKELEKFVSKMPEEDRTMVNQYIKKYTTHWKKTSLQMIEDYKDFEKFKVDFYKWKDKEQSKAA